MKTSVTILAFSLILLMGCKKDDLGPVSNQENSLSKVEVPFKAIMDGLVVITVPPNGRCGSLPMSTVTGSGIAAHVGEFTFESYGCIVPDPQITGKGTFINGTQTLTTANGDKIFATCDGDYITNLSTGIVSYNLYATFTGGTGRFTGVTGDLTFAATAVYGGPGVSKPLHAEGGGKILYANVKPINGKMTGQSDLYSGPYTCSPGAQARQIDLTGHLNIGDGTALMYHCSGVTSANGGVLKNGTATLTLIDGTINVTYEGAFTFDHPYPNQTCANIHTLNGVITGGTGAYAGAQGYFGGVGVQYFSTTPTPVELKVEGYIIK